MRIMKAILTVCVLIVFSIINVDLAFSQEDLSSEIKDEELEQEFKWLKAETYVITASRVRENIKKAPASITVITDKQIQQMGAMHLADVLGRAVPNFNVGIDYFWTFYFGVRGGWAPNKILIMINGHPLNNAIDGTALMHDTLIIDNIKRIELIRGPGSALYGANAYHGVINVITKESEDIDGFELTARGGSWDTQQYNLLYGKTYSDLEVAFNFNYFKTHGYRAFIEKDFQTQIDEFWGAFGFPPASLAPGRTNSGDEKYDVALNLKFKGFTFDGRYVDREKTLPFSWFPALNEGTIDFLKDYYLNLGYETTILEGLDLSGKLYRNHMDNPVDCQFFPPGYTTMTPTGPATWKDGFFGEFSNKSTRTGIEIQATYRISDSNTIVTGATYEDQKWYDNSVSANFLPTAVPNVFIQLPSVKKWPDAFTIDTQKRNFKAVFLEDIWDITDDIRLTTGVRYDRYSDFGSEVSPRVGLTWEYIKGYDLKLLYGHAFRAPNFNEIYYTTPGSELDPETVDTYEVSLGADVTSSFSGRITLYHKEEENLIFAILPVDPFNFVNMGKARDQGFEVEAKYDFGRGTYLSGYYVYRSVKSGPGDSNYDASLRANIRLSRYLNFYADCIYFDGSNRVLEEDPRDDFPSVTLVSATLIAKKFLKGYEGLELRSSVYNLFDKDYKIGMPLEIPNDLPMPGINYLLEMKYKF